MTQAAPVIYFPPLTKLERLRGLTGVALAGIIMLAWGSRWLLAPLDPVGCVSMWCSKWGLLLIPFAALLAVTVAIGVTWISQGRLEELGVFGVALGLALASGRYENSQYLWSTIGQGTNELRQKLALMMLVECIAWLAVLGAVWIGCRWTQKQMHHQKPTTPTPQDELRRGLMTLLFMSVLGLILVPIFSAGSQLAPISTGQVFLAWGLGGYLAALFAYQLTGAHSPGWCFWGIGALAIIGCLWSWFNPTPTYPGRLIGHFTHFSPSEYTKALPIQMISIGLCGALFGNWQQRQLTRYAYLEDQRQADD
ncbi:MAG: hypothetical protein HJJLKODD_02003 [Phycisphaerae bacterium]|nr:hypothetical protein [Phycisphaerae bacterium]